MWWTSFVIALWHRECTAAARSRSLSKGGTQINSVLIAVMLVFALLVTLAPASAGGRGDTYIEVGGIPKAQKGGESDLYRRIENSLPSHGSSAYGAAAGRGGSIVPDTIKRSGESLSGGGGHPLPYSGGLVEKPQTAGGGTTLPWSNTGTFPPSNQLCSSTDVTIGPDTQSRVHCSNTVGGTLRQ